LNYLKVHSPTATIGLLRVFCVVLQVILRRLLVARQW